MVRLASDLLIDSLDIAYGAESMADRSVETRLDQVEESIRIIQQGMEEQQHVFKLLRSELMTWLQQQGFDVDELHEFSDSTIFPSSDAFVGCVQIVPPNSTKPSEGLCESVGEVILSSSEAVKVLMPSAPHAIADSIHQRREVFVELQQPIAAMDIIKSKESSPDSSPAGFSFRSAVMMLVSLFTSLMIHLSQRVTNLSRIQVGIATQHQGILLEVLLGLLGKTNCLLHQPTPYLGQILTKLFPTSTPLIPPFLCWQKSVRRKSRFLFMLTGSET